MKKGVIAGILAIVVVGGIAAAVMVMNKDKTNKDTSSSTDMSNMNAGDNNNSSNSSTPVATDKVSIENFAFSPDNITVKKGTTVTWTNNDSTAHTVDGDSEKSIESGTLNKGDTYTFTFNTVGTFKYHCDFHSDMHGTVTVTE